MVQSATKAPTMRPTLARVSSAASGLRFCGMIELPVVKASDSAMKPNGGLQVAQHRLQAVARVAHPQPDVERDLVVARTRGMQPAAGRADQRGETRLDVEMDVLELGRELEVAGLDLRAHLEQAAPDCTPVLRRQDSPGDQHVAMGERARDVLRVEPAVETH